MSEVKPITTKEPIAGGAVFTTDRVQPVESWFTKWRAAFRRQPAQSETNLHIPQTTPERLGETLNDAPVETSNLSEEIAQDGLVAQQTILYLAYGSNLSRKAFRQTRGIRPLSMRNVLVPELCLTFDLPGLPYVEPCFANTHYKETGPSLEVNGNSHPPSPKQKQGWNRGLVGVVYEVTMKDFAHIIRTEGGGTSYRDVLVDCFALPTDSILPVPKEPSGKPFKAHTLMAPTGGIMRRPKGAKAQPSPRYLKLLTDGARELSLPDDYQSYLQSLVGFRVTTKFQIVGRFLFILIWAPAVTLVFRGRAFLADKRGRYPEWSNKMTIFLFKTMWMTYDRIFKPVFGNGEHTIEPK